MDGTSREVRDSLHRMRGMIRGLLVFIGAITVVSGQPFIYNRRVVSAASFTPPGLPNGAIAQGSIFSIFGSNLGPSSSPALSFPLQTTLGGVSITVANSSTTVNAIPIYVSTSQINAIMPSNAPLGMVSVRVSFNNLSSNAAPVRVTATSFGIFTATGSGIGPGILQNFIASNQQPLNTLQQPAMPGQVLTLWGTGLGPVSFPDNVAPTPGSLPIQTEVFVGGKSAKLMYSGRSPCCAGVDQIVFQIPTDSPLGCWVPVSVRTAGTTVSNFVTIAISSKGSPCSEPNNPIGGALAQGGKIGVVLAGRVAVHDDVAVKQTVDTTADLAAAWFGQQKQQPFAFNPLMSLPPPGSCTGYGSAATGVLPGQAPSSSGLDAGKVAISGSGGSKTLSPSAFTGTMASILGSAVLSYNNPFLNPGTYSVSGSGGSNVGSFQASVNVPQPLTWSNRDQTTVVTRNAGLTVEWSGVTANQSVFVYGLGVDLPTNTDFLFFCRANPGDTSFTVPPAVLANMPATRAQLTQSLGAIYLGQWSITKPTTLATSGLDFGSALAAGVIGKTVVFQ